MDPHDPKHKRGRSEYEDPDISHDPEEESTKLELNTCSEIDDVLSGNTKDIAVSGQVFKTYILL
jgi:hypothetical protein